MFSLGLILIIVYLLYNVQRTLYMYICTCIKLQKLHKHDVVVSVGELYIECGSHSTITAILYNTLGIYLISMYKYISNIFIISIEYRCCI